MASLWIATPFAKDECDDAIARELIFLASQRTPVPVGGNNSYYFDDCRPSDAYALQAGIYGLSGRSFSGGDALVLVAHGQSNSKNLFSACGGGASMTAEECIAGLGLAGASRLSKIFFAVPYSAKLGHCARSYAVSREGRCRVWGISGPLETRNFKKGSVFNAAVSVDEYGNLLVYPAFTEMTSRNVAGGGSTFARAGKRTLGRI